jgi:hypothetical protein
VIDLRKHGASVRGVPLVAVSERLADRLRCTDPARLAQRLPGVLVSLDDSGEGQVMVVTGDGVSVVRVRAEVRRDGVGVLLAAEVAS